MGAMSDEAALSRATDWAQAEIDAAIKRIKDAPADFLDIHVGVENGSAWLTFNFRSEEVDIEIITDPDRAELHDE